MKTTLMVTALVLALHGVAFGFYINEGVGDIEPVSGTIEINEDIGEIDTLPDDFTFELDPTRWNKEKWEILLEDAIEKKIHNNELTTLDGRPIKTYTYHKSGIILGAASNPVQTITINQVSEVTAKDIEALVMFRDQNNNVYQPNPSDIAFFDFNFSRLGFKNRTLKQVIDQIHVYIKIDRSGSMDGNMDEVIEAAKLFMKNVPNGVKCSVEAFNDTFIPLGPQNASCHAVWPRVIAPEASGNSAIYSALTRSYQNSIRANASRPEKAVVILITDGGNTDSLQLKTVIENRDKSGAITFIYWAGPVDKTFLQGVANYEVNATEKIGEQLKKYFENIAVFVKGQIAYRLPKIITSPAQASGEVAQVP